MTKHILFATSALALLAATPAVAQHSGMNMSMPMPAEAPASPAPTDQGSSFPTRNYHAR